MEQSTKDMLIENNYIDVQEVLIDREAGLTDADVASLAEEFGLDFTSAAGMYVSTYSGASNFVQSLKAQLVRKGGLTLPQVRGALNVLQGDLKAGRIKIARKDGRAEPIRLAPKAADPNPVKFTDEVGLEQPDEQHTYKCYKCGLWFTSMDSVMSHKTAVHYGRGKAVPVLKDEEVEATLLDISAIPDGRYAIPDPSGKNDYLFFAVKTVKSRTYRDRKYRYGKFRIGHEWIDAGTIEVRLWSQDAKQWIGAQRPGEGYRGAYVDQLVQIMQAPQAWALVFSSFIGCCSICGKTLTDHDSRTLGIGPDCEKRWGADYWTRWSRTAAIEEAAKAAEAADAAATSISAAVSSGAPLPAGIL